MIAPQSSLESLESAVKEGLSFLELSLASQVSADHVHGSQRLFMVQPQRLFLLSELLLQGWTSTLTTPSSGMTDGHLLPPTASSGARAQHLT